MGHFRGRRASYTHMRLTFPLRILAAFWLCLAVSRLQAGTRDATEAFAKPAYKSVAAAYSWSILGTAVPFLIGTQIRGNRMAAGLVVGGLLVGPSLGQFYAGSLGGGLLGTGIRTGGAFLGVLGMALLFRDAFCMDNEECSGNGNAGGAPVMILGICTYLGGAVYSLMDAERAVGRYNARQNDGSGFGWSPTVAPTSHGGLQPGVSAWMRF